MRILVNSGYRAGKILILDSWDNSFAFVEYETPEQAVAAVKHLHDVPLDKKHTLSVNKLMDVDRYGREGRVDEEYKPPHVEPFKEKEHLRAWLADPSARDQFALFRGDKVGVFWNNKSNPPENVVDRAHWTQLFVQWSPKGSYLASVHPQGIQLWGGPSFSKQKQFPHPFVQLVEFSPLENYMTTWSARPIQVEEGQPVLTYEEDGKNIIIWDIATGKPLRSFVSHDLTAGPMGEGDTQPKKKVQWPAFKWSADEKYVARMLQHQSISIYETPRMNLLGKTSVKIDGVMDFEWSPATTQREGIKQYEQLLCFWTPEMGSSPARVGMMSVPSKEIVRTRNLFNVSDVKLHWQSQGTYVCVKVDRHSKSKKSLATNLEIFRVREKGVPVEVVDMFKDTVINFAWEPNGSRFVVITTGEAPAGAAVAPKTAVSFFAPEKKGHLLGSFKLIRTLEKKNSNAIYWSPKGRFVVVAAVHSQTSFDMDFWDMDFEGDKPEAEKDLAANLQLMKTADHYGVTDIDWDPTGRYVVSSASAWTHSVRILPSRSSRDRVLIVNCRWKTVGASTLSPVPLSPNTLPTSSSSSSGVPVPPPCSARKNRSRCARTSGNTRRNSKRRTSTLSTLPTRPLSRPASVSSTNLLPGSVGRRSSWPKTRKPTSCPKMQMIPSWPRTQPPCPRTMARLSSRRWWRRLSRSTRKSLVDWDFLFFLLFLSYLMFLISFFLFSFFSPLPFP